MLRATTSWWKRLLQANPEFEKYEFPRWDDDRLATLQSAINPENRSLFRAVGDHIAGFGTLSEAAVALAYAFARTYVAGATNPDDPYGGGHGPGGVITGGQWETIQIVYGPDADWQGYVQQGPWWDWQENQTTTTQYAVRAVRWAYRDQVKRWSDAVGAGMECSIGLDTADIEFKDFIDLLFEWGARIQATEVYAMD
jgi:hypothetical protein